MFLTKAEIDLASRIGAECIRDMQRLHSIVTGLCNGTQYDNHVVYRSHVETNKIIVYFYSDCGAVKTVPGVIITGERDVSSWVDHFVNLQTYQFDIYAIPSKKVKVEGKKNSSRRLLMNLGERLDWLKRKAEQNGFEIIGVQEQKEIRNTVKHAGSKGGVMHINGFQYQGVLKITDEVKFRKALQQGIGSGKAYGFGMMLIK